MIIIEDFQNIIENHLDKQELISATLRAITTELKRNKLNKIVDISEQGCAVVEQYKKNHLEVTLTVARTFDGPKQEHGRRTTTKNQKQLP